ncbi:MAG: SURF1 family protein [Trueperaceae bacterium]|nr:MAG: SURF1 family protein [Trueperaceae bacterium]
MDVHRSGAWRSLLTPGWIVGHLLAISVVVSFSQFGTWQLRRHEQSVLRNATIEARLDIPATDIAGVLRAAAAEPSALAPMAPHPLEFRRVRVTGRFDAAAEVLRRPVSRDGSPGYHVVTPVVLDDGSAVLVERGWVPQSLDSVPVSAAPPPAGVVTIEGWAFPGETPPTGPLAALAPRDPPDGRLAQVAYVDLERLSAQLPYPLQPLRILQDAGPRPPGDATLPLPPRPPEVALGPHLGYAVQWFGFVLVTLIGYTALLRRRLAEAEEALKGSSAPP